jgi:hypothetical protein
MTDQNHTNDTVPQSGRAVTYTRVTPGPQTTMLQPQVAAQIAFANAQGYPPERITVYAEVGVSARTNPAHVALFRSQCRNASELFEEAKRMIYQRTARRNRQRKKQD